MRRLLITLLCLPLAACGDDSGQVAAPPAAQTVTVVQTAAPVPAAPAPTTPVTAPPTSTPSTATSTSTTPSSVEPDAKPSATLSAADVRRELGQAADGIRDYIALINSNNVRVCTDAYTQTYVEFITRKKGFAAVVQCRKDVKAIKNSIRLVSFGAGRAKKDRVLLEYTLKASGRNVSQIVRMIEDKKNGYRIDGDGTTEALEDQNKGN